LPLNNQKVTFPKLRMGKFYFYVREEKRDSPLLNRSKEARRKKFIGIKERDDDQEEMRWKKNED